MGYIYHYHVSNPESTVGQGQELILGKGSSSYIAVKISGNDRLGLVPINQVAINVRVKFHCNGILIIMFSSK